MRKKVRKMNEKIQNGKFYRKPGLVFTLAPSNGLIISVGIFYVWRMQTCLSWSFWVVGKQRHHHDFSWLLLLYIRWTGLGYSTLKENVILHDSCVTFHIKEVIHILVFQTVFALNFYLSYLFLWWFLLPQVPLLL